MEIENGMTEEEILEKLEEKRQQVINFSLEEILERLEKSLNDTDVVLDGYNLVNNIAVGDGIALAGILKLREVISETMDWMMANLDEEEETEENEEL